MFARFITITAFVFSGICLYGQDSSWNKKALLLSPFNHSASQFKQAFLNSPVLPRPKNYVDSFSQLAKSIVAPFKNPVVVNNASVLYTWIHDDSYLSRNAAYSFGNLDISGELSLAGIPVMAGFQNQAWSDASGSDPSRFSFRFDKDQYLEAIKNKLSGKFDPASLLGNAVNPFENIMNKAKQALQDEITGLSHSYGGLLESELKKIGGLQTLFKKDINEIRKSLLSPDRVKGLQDKERLIALLQQKINNGETINADEMNALEQDVQKVKAINALIEKIVIHKARWEQSGLLSKLRNFEMLQKYKIGQLLKDPSIIRKLAKQHLSLKGLQKFFLHVNGLNIGQNSLSLSPMSFQNFLSNGITAELINNKARSIALLAGKQKDFNSILDYAFSDNLHSNNGIAKAIRMQIGSGNHSSTHISVSTFNQSLAAGLWQPADLNRFRQVMVTTISNQLNIGQKGFFAIDLSRSATQYQGSGTGADSLLSGGNLHTILSANNLMSNTAISLKYADEYTATGLSYQLSFNKVANGYVNPGNTFLSGGSTEAGLMVKKSFFKNKMIVSLRGNARWYQYNDHIDKKWKNGFYVADIKWRLKKGQNISLRYQPVRMIRIEGKDRNLVTAVERVTAEANLFKQWRKISYRNYFSLTGQKNIYATTGLSHEKNFSLLISSFQNIMIGKKIFYVNINYNHSGNNAAGYFFLNSSLFAEGGYSYRIGKNITGSTGYIYTSTKNWYRQTGIRQSISGQLGERLVLNFYIDAKKDLKVYQEWWADPVRADISLRYSLQNKH